MDNPKQSKTLLSILGICTLNNNAMFFWIPLVQEKTHLFSDDFVDGEPLNSKAWLDTCCVIAMNLHNVIVRGLEGFGAKVSNGLTCTLGKE